MSLLYVKHRVATCSLARPASRMRTGLSRLKLFRTPELGLLRTEGSLQDAVFSRLLNKRSNCMDVGAHIGSVSYAMSRAAPDGQHIIVEAVPHKAGWLKTRFPRATVHQCAVSDHVGELSFFENLDKPGFSSITARDGRGRVKEHKIPCTTLDTLAIDHPKLDFIKIDVEGYEWEAVQGARHILKTARPVVMFEAGAVHDSDSDNGKYIKLFEYFTCEIGYDVYALFDFHYDRAPLTLEAFQSYRTYPFLSFNFLASPRG